jgi:hypothetical protein
MGIEGWVKGRKEGWMKERMDDWEKLNFFFKF